ncbi:DUF6196 family protein [Streptomyces misionensis]|uniref:DUF6196 family protein n=1 Tax=Streptomyces misionensis TaxID=67331 RepID=UPI0033F2132D
METAEQTEQRPRRVIAQADLVVHDGVWCFEESPTDQPPALTRETLAVVRDQESWSRLVPLTQQGRRCRTLRNLLLPLRRPGGQQRFRRLAGHPTEG